MKMKLNEFKINDRLVWNEKKLIFRKKNVENFNQQLCWCAKKVKYTVILFFALLLLLLFIIPKH